MADFVNRSDWEAQLAHALAGLQQRELKRLMDALGDPPDLNNLHPEFWNEFSTTLRGELVPTLEKIFLDSAEQMLGTSSIGVDWDLVNQAATDWAARYGYDLVRGITDNTRAALQQKVSSYFQNGWTQQALRDSLQSLFGPVRASMISVTEVTRAAVQGELAIVKEIEKNGIKMIPIFQTSADSFVCPICAPLNGKQVQSWQFPPRHVNCRCWINHAFAEA